MKLNALLAALFVLLTSSAYSADDSADLSVWRLLTDSKYRAAHAKQSREQSLIQTRRMLPIAGRLAVCERAQEIVSAPLEWQDNTRRLAEIPVVLHACGIERTQDFKDFEVSAIALIEFGAQLQSSTREEVSRQLASERQRATHTINAEASIDPKLLAKYAGVLDSEHQASAELSSIEKRDFPSLTPAQATTFRLLYAHLLSAYAAVTQQMPTMTELMDAANPSN